MATHKTDVNVTFIVVREKIVTLTRVLRSPVNVHVDIDVNQLVGIHLVSCGDLQEQLKLVADLLDI